MQNEDIIYCNSLLYQLVRLKDIRHGYVHYLRKCIEEDNSALFFTVDQKTRVFNRSGIEIYKSDFLNVFEGRVALSIKGIYIVDSYHVYLDASVYQVKVEEEEDMKADASHDCIFE